MKGTFMGQLAQQRPTSGRVYTCKIGDIIAAADDEDRAAILEDFGNDDISNRALGRWLGVSENTVNKHRFGGCACSRG